MCCEMTLPAVGTINRVWRFQSVSALLTRNTSATCITSYATEGALHRANNFQSTSGHSGQEMKWLCSEQNARKRVLRRTEACSSESANRPAGLPDSISEHYGCRSSARMQQRIASAPPMEMSRVQIEVWQVTVPRAELCEEVPGLISQSLAFWLKMVT